MATRLTQDRKFFASAGLMAAGVVAVVQYASLPELSLALIVSAAFFALSIPMLAVHVNFRGRRLEGEIIEVKTASRVAYWIGASFAAAGFAALFWHLAPWLGVLFVIASTVSFFTIDAGRNKERRIY